MDQWNAIFNIGKTRLGLVAVLVEKAPSRETVGGMLAQLSPEDQAILIARYVPAPAPAKKGKQ